jgi:hypothetical protein
MPRETKQIEIEGHKFVVKTYATAREVNAIQAAYFKGTKVEVVGDQPKILDFNPAIQSEVNAELIRQMVVSVNGQTENVVDICLDGFPSHICTALVAELDALVSKKKS